MAAPKVVDYARIEPDWRAGLKSVPMMCAEYEAATGQAVSKSAINKHFRNLGIPRDLSAKINAKADAMVSAAMVSGKVSVTGEETLPADAVIINSAATTSANVQLSHRADIRSLRAKANEYESQLSFCEEDLAKRTSILKMLAEIQCKLIAVEREAYGLDKDKPTDTGLSSESVSMLKKLKAQLEDA